MTRWLIAGLIAVLAAAIHLYVFTGSIGSRLEPVTLDWWSALSGPRAVPDDVLILAMDEISYGALGLPLNQPWPRALHARLLEQLAKVGVKRVIFDVLFLDASADPAADRALAKALAAVPTVLGVDSIMKDQSGGAGSFKLEEVLYPYEPFAKAAENLGLVGLPEENGYMRQFRLSRTAMTKELPTLSEAAVKEVTRRPSTRDFIRFYGPRGTIPTYSFAQAIDPDRPLPAALLKGKTVFVGLVLQTDVGPAQKDIFLTPYGRIFGTEIHATAALNMLHDDWMTRSSGWLEALVLTIIALIGVGAIFLLRPIFGIAVWLFIALGWSVLSFIGFKSGFFVPGLMLSWIILPFCLLSSLAYFYFVTRKAHLKMESAFELYLSPQMAKEVANSPEALSLGGEKIWATALFTDIAGFTSITEELPAERVSAMLNAYFTEVVDVVLQHNGTLIKFIGDSVFVIWGAPLKMNDHAEKACQAALAIRRAIDRFNATGKYPPLKTRIGLNTGPMLVGNLGSARRFDYTAIGDSVNLASRVEGSNKYFGSTIMITDSTEKEIGNRFPTLFVGAIRVVGKREAIGLHLLLDDPLPAASITLWTTALDKFRRQDWDDATGAFNTVRSQVPLLAKAAECYLSEIEHYRKTPPDETWSGEVSLDEK